MNYKKHLPELLAPAGSLEHLKAAVLAGADAVYFGGSRFGARAYAENFTREAVIEGLDFVHFHDRRAYMTVNTLVKERELREELYEYLLPYYEAGLDGVIVQDLGAASFIREHFPGMEVHGSTQMNITDVSGARMAKEMGMNRVVPARELSMEEMVRIKKETGLEVEVFIHGALCYCYSGQCLFSSMYGGRSGNRGRCAQPCRLPYRLFDAKGSLCLEETKHLLSPKDLCSLDTLPDIIENGMDSLKIEGRMKNVEYVAGVVAIYRKYLDLYAENPAKWKIAQKDRDILEELYTRGGFTDGYWKRHNSSQMMSIDYPRHLGLEVGKIQGIRKNQLFLELTQEVTSKDLLVIPGSREEEIVLTVPSQLDKVMQKKKKVWNLTLNAAKNRWLKPGLTVYRRHNELLSHWIQQDILAKKLKYPVYGRMRLRQGEAMELILSSRGDELVMTGVVPDLAQNRPISKEDILKQMKKTGNVPFTLEDMVIDLQDGLFVQASLLKELRQKAYEALEREHVEKFHRIGWSVKNEDILANSKEMADSLAETVPVKEKKIDLIAAVYDDNALQACLSQEMISGLTLSMDFYNAQDLLKMKSIIHSCGKEAYLSLPQVFRNVVETDIHLFLRNTVKDGEKWDGIYINNINQLDILPKEWHDIPRIYGASLYQWNQASRQEILRLDKAVWEKTNVDFPTNYQNNTASHIMEFPYESSRGECLALMEEGQSYECLLYGVFPVMRSAQCLKMTLGLCNHCEEILHLEDRNKRKLPVSTHCSPSWYDSKENSPGKQRRRNCYNLIWKDEARNLIGEEFGDILPSIKRFRMDFFGCKINEINEILHDYESWKISGYEKKSGVQSFEDHWNMGIE